MSAPLPDHPLIAVYAFDAGMKIHSHVAFFVVAERYGDNKVRSAFLPMHFPGSSREAATAAAVNWWNAEREKEAAKIERIAKAREARKAPKLPERAA